MSDLLAFRSVNTRHFKRPSGNFWFGAPTTVNGIEIVNTYHENSRIGATASIPLTKHQSVKNSYSDGDYIPYGGGYLTVSIAWQYGWLGRPK
jgi:hypothetical protein